MPESDFQIHSTPDPTQFTVSMRVPDQTFNPELIQRPGSPIVLRRLLPYKETGWALREGGRVKEYGDYVYSFCRDDGPGFKRFFFVKPKTQEERNTPFETIWSSRPVSWPAVLEDLWFIRTNRGLATEYAYARRRYRPAVNVASQIRIDHYLSEVPWSKQATTHEEPIPTEVSGTMLVVVGSGGGTRLLPINVDIGKCLHPEVILSGPLNVASAERIPNAGTIPQSYVGNPTGNQVFPPTNMGDWQTYVLQDTVQPVGGLYLREKVTVFPPKRGEALEA